MQFLLSDFWNLELNDQYTCFYLSIVFIQMKDELCLQALRLWLLNVKIDMYFQVK